MVRLRWFSVSKEHSSLLIRKALPLVVVFSLLVFTACLHTPTEVPEAVLDLEKFINFYQNYQIHCPYFAHKGINWIELMEEYYGDAILCNNEDELAEVAGNMLAELHDPWIRLYKRNSSHAVIDSIIPYVQEYEINYSMDLLEDHYLEQFGWAGWEEGYCQGMGWSDPGIIPYMFLDTIPADNLSSTYQEAFDSLDVFVADCIDLNVPGIIIDIRMNPHGSYEFLQPQCGHAFIGRFASRTYPGAIYRRRTGPEYDQYFDWRPTVSPTGPVQFTGTVILLVGENSSQWSESMTANFINFTNVVLVGDITRGNVSFGNKGLNISDNWSTNSVRNTVLTYDKFWIEGAGIPPDFYVEASEGAFSSGVDPVLEFAIEMLYGKRYPSKEMGVSL